MQRMTFGNVELSVIDPHERDTRYIYDEIFVSQIYYHPNMRMPRHPVIMDVGANIGIFGVWAHRRHQPSAIFCYEASPQTFEYLRDNTSRLVDAEITKVHTVNRAVACKAGETLTLHQSPLVSGISTLLDKSKVGWVKELAASQELVSHEVKTTTVSAEIATQALAHIDLLKIDVEGYFMEVLGGISPADFPKIKNIVIEIDYAEEVGVTLKNVEDLLRANGYQTECRELTFYAWRH